MKRTHRIVLEDRLLPVQVFFNSIPDRRFVGTLEAFARGVGAGFDLAACIFPGDLPEGENPIKGIEFSLTSGESVTLTYTDFFNVLRQACEVFITDCEDQKIKVESLLAEINELLKNPNSPTFKPGHNILS